MRILFYNLGYGRGHDGSLYSYVCQSYRFIRSSQRQQRTTLDAVAALVEREQPDVFAYAEISTGSFRNQHFDQHRYLLKCLGESTIADAVVSKYGETMLNLAPFHAGNCNGVITFQPAVLSEHYLNCSRKKLVFRIEMSTVTIFAVHLPLITTDRREQLLELADLVNQTAGNVVVCGDFNILNGLDELEIMRGYTNLVVAGTGMPTYPSVSPRLQLDVFLYRISNLSGPPRLRTYDLRVSDHVPILLEW